MADSWKNKIMSEPVSSQGRSVSEEGSGDKRHVSIHLKLILLLGAIAFLTYANTLRNGFALDDKDVIRDNKFVTQGISAIPQLLATPYRRGLANLANDLYRPLSLVSFAVEYQLFELNPMPYHLINILVFVGCVILLFLFFNKLFSGKPAVAFIAALLFALHPIHTEVVANIKSRDELLCFFFAFLSLNVLIRYLQSGKMAQLLTGIACFFLALLSKETAITFLGIIPLVFFFYRNEDRKRSINITIGAAIAAAIFLAIRFSVLHSYNAGHLSDVTFIDNALAKEGLTSESGIATAVLMLGYYIRLLFIPYPLISDYSYNTIPFTHFSDPWVLLSAAVYIGLAVFAISRLKRKDPLAFAVLFLLMSIVLFSNIPFLIGTTMGERFLFFGSAGFCLAIALFIERLAAKATGSIVALKQPLVLGVLITLSLSYAAMAVDRNSEWKDNNTLFRADIQKAPNNARLYYNLGYELENTYAVAESDPAAQKHTREEAVSLFRQAISIYPGFADAHANLGFLFFHLAMFDSAEAHDKIALRLKPAIRDVANNLAQVYYTTKNYQLSIDVCEKSLQSNPAEARLYANICAGFGNMGRYDSAIHYAKIGVSVDPGINALYENIAYCYKLMGNWDSAGKYEVIAQKNNPRFRLR